MDKIIPWHLQCGDFQETFPGKDQSFAKNEEIFPPQKERIIEFQETYYDKEETQADNEEIFPPKEERVLEFQETYPV